MRVVVVGGGLAGLFIASGLLANDIDDLIVVEKSPVPGGVARTVRRDGFSLEPAAGSFNLPHPHLSPILARAGAETEAAPAASVRHVYVGGRLVSLRPSPAALLAPVLPISAKLRALAEPFISTPPPAEESLGGFCRRRFGRRTGDLMASILAGGVYAGAPDELSVSAAFPMLAALEEQHGSVLRGALRRRRSASGGGPRPRLHVPKTGMSGLAATLAESLGDRFRADFAVDSVGRRGDGWVVGGPEQMRADVVVLALPPRIAAGLLEDELSACLLEATAAEVAVVGVGGHGASPLPDGFGALIGPDEGMYSVGALFESSYAPSRAPEGSWLAKVIVGGARHPQIAGMTDEQVAEVTIGELGRLVDVDLSPGFVEVVRHRPGIPQYGSGHRKWLERLDGLAPAGLHLAGWGYRGVGVGRLATEAASLAEIVKRPEA